MLRPVKSKHPHDPRQPATPASDEGPALPIWKAFVLQFSRETNPRTRTFSGRVEHMSSGRRARFASKQGLLAVLKDMLADLGENAT